MFAFQAGILNGNTCIVAFPATVSVEQVETDSQAEVGTKITALDVSGDIVFVEGIAITAVHLQIRIVAGTNLFVIQLGKRVVLIGFQQRSVGLQSHVPKLFKV